MKPQTVDQNATRLSQFNDRRSGDLFAQKGGPAEELTLCGEEIRLADILTQHAQLLEDESQGKLF